MAPEKPTIRRRAATELTATELHDLLRLRVDVFVVEQACPYHELDGRDLEPGTEHRWIEVDGTVASAIRLLTEPDGSTRIGRVVTDPAHRGAGLAGTLIRTVTDEIGGTIRIDAQAHLRAWYQSFGFEACGPIFVEDGIDHLPMVRP